MRGLTVQYLMQYIKHRYWGDNISQYSIVMVTDDSRNLDLAQGIVDNLTSTFSENITIPTLLPSNAYDVEVRFDFYSQQPEGGPYYASEDPIFDPATESLPHYQHRLS